MTTLARIGYGAAFLTDNGDTPRTWTTFGEVVNLVAPSLARDKIDTSHEEPPGSWRSSIAGMKDGGELRMDFNLVPTSIDTLGLMDEFESLTEDTITRTRRLVFPDGSYLEFDAYLGGFDSNVPVADRMSGS